MQSNAAHQQLERMRAGGASPASHRHGPPASLSSWFACMPMKKPILAVLVVVGILAVAGVYHLYRGASIKSAQPCWSKLVKIAGAKDQWAIETRATSGAPVRVENIVPYLSSMPTCHVAGATYIIGKVGEEPRCTTHGTVSHFNPDHY